MTAMWFGLAAIAFAGAAALLYIDHMHRQQSGRVRQMWAKAQGYTFTESDPHLPSTWHRAALAKQDYLSAVDIVSGVRRGEQFFLFDLEETATIIAVRREIGSDVDIDLRLKSSPPPRDHDLELLGAIGERMVFSNNLEIARRVCDQRMIGFTESLPDKIQMLWSEGFWTLASLPVSTPSREWDICIDAAARLSGILHVLPPPRSGRRGGAGASARQHDPGHPQHPGEAVDDAPTSDTAERQPVAPRPRPVADRPGSSARPGPAPMPQQDRAAGPQPDRWAGVTPFPQRRPISESHPGDGPDLRL